MRVFEDANKVKYFVTTEAMAEVFAKMPDFKEVKEKAEKAEKPAEKADKKEKTEE